MLPQFVPNFENFVVDQRRAVQLNGFGFGKWSLFTRRLGCIVLVIPSLALEKRSTFDVCVDIHLFNV